MLWLSCENNFCLRFRFTSNFLYAKIEISLLLLKLCLCVAHQVPSKLCVKISRKRNDDEDAEVIILSILYIHSVRMHLVNARTVKFCRRRKIPRRPTNSPRSSLPLQKQVFRTASELATYSWTTECTHFRRNLVRAAAGIQHGASMFH